MTAFLAGLRPYLPLSNFPIPYVLLIMAVAYLFGEGPAIMAFVVGFIAFVGIFTYPEHFHPHHVFTPEGWARLVAFLLGTSVVGFATLMMRRSAQSTRRFARELAEANRLAESRRSELDAILSSMVNAVVVVDLNQTVIYANQAADNLVPLQRSVDQKIEDWIQGVNIRELDGTPISPDNHPLVLALKGGTVTEKLMLINGEDGPDTIVSATSAPVYDSTGSLTGAAVVVRNMTLQMRLQEEVERQRALLAAFMQNVPMGLIFQDRNGRCIMANRALADINALPLEQMLGRRAAEYLPPEYAVRVEHAISQVMSTGQPVHWHDYWLPLDLSRCFEVEFLPVNGADGTMIGVGTMVVETTEQVLSRIELERVYERERKIAETLQTSLLGAVPKIAGLRFETVYRAALDESMIGGDFYDVFRITPNKIGIVVGDVSGKGLTAAVHVATAKYSIRSHAYETDSPGRVMEMVNETMLHETDAEGFITIFAGVLDIARRTLTYTNCGHEPVIFWRSASGKAEMLPPTGPIIGAIPGIACLEKTMALEPGDEILLATDGLFEIRCGEGRLEVEGLLELFTELKKSGNATALALIERVTAFCEGNLRDDVAILRVALEKDVPDEAGIWPTGL